MHTSSTYPKASVKVPFNSSRRTTKSSPGRKLWKNVLQSGFARYSGKAVKAKVTMKAMKATKVKVAMKVMKATKDMKAKVAMKTMKATKAKKTVAPDFQVHIPSRLHHIAARVLGATLHGREERERESARKGSSRASEHPGL